MYSSGLGLRKCCRNKRAKDADAAEGPTSPAMEARDCEGKGMQ
jgi:hypothetical protein